MVLTVQAVALLMNTSTVIEHAAACGRDDPRRWRRYAGEAVKSERRSSNRAN